MLTVVSSIYSTHILYHSVLSHYTSTSIRHLASAFFHPPLPSSSSPFFISSTRYFGLIVGFWICPQISNVFDTPLGSFDVYLLAAHSFPFPSAKFTSAFSYKAPSFPSHNCYNISALSRLRLSLAGISLRRPCVETSPRPVGFVVDGVALKYACFSS
jgi:hypothetical protein